VDIPYIVVLFTFPPPAILKKGCQPPPAFLKTIFHKTVMTPRIFLLFEYLNKEREVPCEKKVLFQLDVFYITNI